MIAAPREHTEIRARLPRWIIAAAAITLFDIWLRAGFPVHAIDNSNYDDDLFLRLARSIVRGQWLGRYDNTTLVKGPFYSLFIAAAFGLHLRLKLAEQVAYDAASALVAWVLITSLPRSGRHTLLGLGLYAALCLDPILWYAELGRVIREGLYISLSLGVFGLTAMISFPPAAIARRRAILSGAALGLVGGAYWITREEGVWLVPSLLAIVLIGLIRRRPVRLALPPGMPTSGLAAASGFAAVILSVSALNDRHYGVFETNEVKSAAFEHAYGAISRIRPDHWQRYMVFPKDARARAYAASPAARELEPVLEGPFGQQWSRVTCARYGIRPCTGFHAGWWQWVFREAVAQAGHYTSAPEAASYYRRLAREIDAACAERRLDCLPPRATLAPPFRWHYVGDTWREAGRMVAMLLAMGGGDMTPQPSVGDRASLDAIEDLVGPVAPSSPTRFDARGWVAAPQGRPSIRVQPRGFGSDDTSVDLSPAGDVELAYPGLHAVRFTITTDCPPAACDLVLSAPGEPETSVALTALLGNTMPLHGTEKMLIDAASAQPAWPYSSRLQLLQARIAKPIVHAYALAMQALWPLAALGLLLAVAIGPRSGVPAVFYAMAIGSLAALACRIALLSYLQVTSIPATPLYLAPVTPFLILFVATGLVLGGASVSALLRGRHAANPPPRPVAR